MYPNYNQVKQANLLSYVNVCVIPGRGPPNQVLGLVPRVDLRGWDACVSRVCGAKRRKIKRQKNFPSPSRPIQTRLRPSRISLSLMPEIPSPLLSLYLSLSSYLFLVEHHLRELAVPLPSGGPC